MRNLCKDVCEEWRGQKEFSKTKLALLRYVEAKTNVGITTIDKKNTEMKSRTHNGS